MTKIKKLLLVSTQKSLYFLMFMLLIKSSDAWADPAGSGPIIAALGWIQGTLLGNVATAIAVIAVAVVGFSMLTGRMDWRLGATVIVGCFILFGASSIVSGIRSVTAAEN